MPELLIEIGCEELPAHSIERALAHFVKDMESSLKQADLWEESCEIKTACTPRRLIASFSNIKKAQPDKTEQKRGPSEKSAYEENGSPTPALQGFCKSVGVALQEAELRQGYVWVSVHVKGKPAQEIVGDLICHAIRSIPFSKTMRWGGGKMRFARPIRWLVAVFDGKDLEFELETLRSGNVSRGHRFLCPEEFTVSSYKDLIEGLRKRNVEPIPFERENIIRESYKKLSGNDASAFGDLVYENVFLTEYPVAIEGKLKEEFLFLPEEILVTAMAKHERFFPIYQNGKITNRFVSITNGGDPETIRKGNEWVLNARYNDAKFFYDEDSRHSLDEFLEKTKGIVFQEKLGTIYQRSERLARLAAHFAEAFGFTSAESMDCEKSARLCKADLSTGLVSELPAMQGIVGGLYAKREGYSEFIAEAIYHHYKVQETANTPGKRAANLLHAVDCADRVAGFLGIGEIPKGSSDPYGLRGATGRLVELQLLEIKPAVSICNMLEKSAEFYSGQNIQIQPTENWMNDFKEMLFSRYELAFAHYRYDLREAVWNIHWDKPTWEFAMRLQALHNKQDDIPFFRTGKRPANIVSSAIKKGWKVPENITVEEIDRGLFEHDSERALFSATIEANSEIERFHKSKDFMRIIESLEKLQQPISDFFDSVMVMVEDESYRNNRLQLLAWLDSLFKTIADFGVIVIEGE